MNSLVVLCFLVALVSVSQASVWGLGTTLVGPANPGAIVQGPSDGATVVGPDGSAVVGGGQAGVVAAAPLGGGVVSSVVSPGYVSHGLGALLGGGLVLG